MQHMELIAYSSKERAMGQPIRCLLYLPQASMFRSVSITIIEKEVLSDTNTLTL